MGRNPLWKDMRWEEKEDITFFNIRIPKELGDKLKEIVKIEQTTISFLFRKQLITLIRKKCREYHIENLILPNFIYPGPRCHRPKYKRIRAERKIKIPEIQPITLP